MPTHREAAILEALSYATEAESAPLVAELNEIRWERREAALNSSGGFLDPTLAAEITDRVAQRHSAESDWLPGQAAGVSLVHDVARLAKAEANSWYLSTTALVRAEPGEYRIQAEGYADMWASQYGEQAKAMRTAFLRTALRYAGDFGGKNGEDDDDKDDDGDKDGSKSDTISADEHGKFEDNAGDDLSDEAKKKFEDNASAKKDARRKVSFLSPIKGPDGTEYDWTYESDPEEAGSVVVYLLDAESGDVIDSMGGVEADHQVSDHGNTNAGPETEAYLHSVAQEMANGQHTASRTADLHSGDHFTIDGESWYVDNTMANPGYPGGVDYSITDPSGKFHLNGIPAANVVNQYDPSLGQAGSDLRAIPTGPNGGHSWDAPPYGDAVDGLVAKPGVTSARKTAESYSYGDQRSCALCGMDIEFHGADGWIGRGGDRYCDQSGAHPKDEYGAWGNYPHVLHRPYSFQDDVDAGTQRAEDLRMGDALGSLHTAGFYMVYDGGELIYQGPSEADALDAAGGDTSLVLTYPTSLDEAFPIPGQEQLFASKRTAGTIMGPDEALKAAPKEEQTAYWNFVGQGMADSDSAYYVPLDFNSWRRGYWDDSKGNTTYAPGLPPMASSKKGSAMKRTASEMSDDARELMLYIENEYSLYGQLQAIVKNLGKFYQKGTYDPERAIQGFMYLVDAGAKKYHQEFGSGGKWHDLFGVAERREVAKEMSEQYADEFKSGNFEASLHTAATELDLGPGNPSGLNPGKAKDQGLEAPGRGASDQDWCDFYKAMDKVYDTDPDSPLGHNNRCPIHGRNGGRGASKMASSGCPVCGSLDGYAPAGDGLVRCASSCGSVLDPRTGAVVATTTLLSEAARRRVADSGYGPDAHSQSGYADTGLEYVTVEQDDNWNLGWVKDGDDDDSPEDAGERQYERSKDAARKANVERKPGESADDYAARIEQDLADKGTTFVKGNTPAVASRRQAEVSHMDLENAASDRGGVLKDYPDDLIEKALAADTLKEATDMLDAFDNSDDEKDKERPTHRGEASRRTADLVGDSSGRWFEIDRVVTPPGIDATMVTGYAGYKGSRMAYYPEPVDLDAVQAWINGDEPYIGAPDHPTVASRRQADVGDKNDAPAGADVITPTLGWDEEAMFEPDWDENAADRTDHTPINGSLLTFRTAGASNVAAEVDDNIF